MSKDFPPEIQEANQKGMTVIDFTVQGPVLYDEIKKDLEEHFQVSPGLRGSKMGCYEAYVHMPQAKLCEAMEYFISMSRLHYLRNEGDSFLHNDFRVSRYY